MNKEYFLNRIFDELGIENHRLKLFSIFSYGSRIYGNYNENSDYDFIIVKRQIDYKSDTIKTEDGLINCSIYSIQGFQNAIDNHDISALECLFLNDEHILLNNIEWKFNLDLNILRKSISSKSSNSFVKAKKKLLEKDFYIAQKSLYHSLRIIIFGKQIATYGKIVDFKEANHLWYEIQTLDLDWQIWKNKYQSLRNKLLTEFRILVKH